MTQIQSSPGSVQLPPSKRLGDVHTNCISKYPEVRNGGDRCADKTASVQVKQAPVLADPWWLLGLSREGSRDDASTHRDTRTSSSSSPSAHTVSQALCSGFAWETCSLFLQPAPAPQGEAPEPGRDQPAGTQNPAPAPVPGRAEGVGVFSFK